MLPFLVQADPHLAHVQVTYVADRDLKSVSVAAMFNDWDPNKNVLKPDGRTWSTVLALPVGKYQYKLVLDGKQWILDPANPRKEDGGNEPFNSELLVLPDSYREPAKVGDGKINTDGIAFSRSASYVCLDGNTLNVSLKVRPGDVKSVSAVVNGTPYAMKELGGDEISTVMRAQIPWQSSKKGVKLAFRLQDGNSTLWVGEGGLSNKPGKDVIISDIPYPKVADWPQHSVLYEIFPDRFANGNKRNDPPGTVSWDSKPDDKNWFGGDAAGVLQHLDYLKSIGVTGVYFTPVFLANSNHRYTVSDYLTVDPRFATNEEFVDMTRQLKTNGIRTVLDGVFSCTGTEFFAFQDLLKNQQQSAYKDWYTVNSYPVKITDPPPYWAWANYSGLPLVNLKNLDAQKYFLSVPSYWDTKANVDGWRIDSSERLPLDFDRALRAHIKKDGADKWIVGEIWSDASPWLQGDMWDSVMGYQFRVATVDFCATKVIGAKDYLERLMALYASYPPQISRNLMTLIGSHDTPRILTVCKGDKDMALLAATVQLTWPGAPCVYYGEELGMEGFGMHDDRRGMRWDTATEANPFLVHYRKLIQARSHSRALQVGEPIPIFSDDHSQSFAFARATGSEMAIVGVNRGASTVEVSDAVVAKPGTYRDVLSGSRVLVTTGKGLTMRIPPHGAVVLLPGS